MLDPHLFGHAVIALGLTAVLAATPPEPALPTQATPGFVALLPFDEQFVALPPGEPDADASSSTAPPDPASGLFEA